MLVLVLIGSVFSMGCESGGGSAGGAAGGARTSTQSVFVPTEYTFEISGSGVTFSADIHGYEDTNYGGNQQNPGYAMVTLGATANVYSVTAESFIASFTLNSGAGVLDIITKKNGVVVRTDSISGNGLSISINDTN